MARKKKQKRNKISRKNFLRLWRALVLMMLLISAFSGLQLIKSSKMAGDVGWNAQTQQDKEDIEEERIPTNQAEKEIEAYAEDRGYDLSDYTDKLITLYEKNEEARQFVLDYPMKKNEEYTIDLSEYTDAEQVPLFMQWDERWGYFEYAGDVMGVTGCGPTCLSMITVYLTGDDTKNPKWMAQYATEQGYYENGNGTLWSFMSDGASHLGINAKEIPLNQERMIDNLQAGNPIICIMGPGDFTDTGHFIVLTGYQDGGFIVNDPNSYKNSQRIWTFEEIQYQIKNLWVYWQ